MTAAKRKVKTGAVYLDEVTMLTVSAIAEKRHATLDETVIELIQDGITARAQHAATNHQHVRGEVNPRFCRICSKPMA